jgi:hypothetical protein
MPETVTESHDEPIRPALPPSNVREVLRVLVEAGNTMFLDDAGTTMMTGTPDRPGRVVPCTIIDPMAMLAAGLLAGERGLFLARRRGRHIAEHGDLSTFDSRLVAEDLAAWARGVIDYPEAEVLESIEAQHYEVALDRAEALAILIAKGVVTAEGARVDYEPSLEQLRKWGMTDDV